MNIAGFVLDWDAEASTYITGFIALPGNAQMVHHIAAFGETGWPNGENTSR